MKQSEVFMSKLTINRIIENGVCEKAAVLEVADRFGNKTEYDITDSDSIQDMLSHYDEDVPMTIDEAIVHSEEIAAQLLEDADGWVRDGWQECFKKLSPEHEAEMKKEREKKYSECRKCAADHRQLASWLRELKKLKETHLSLEEKVRSVSIIEDDGSVRAIPLDRVIIERR